MNLPLMTFHRVTSSKKSYIVKETWSFQYLWPFSRHQAPKRLRKLFCSNGHGEGNSLLFFWYKICWILFSSKLSWWWFLLEMNLYKTSRLLVPLYRQYSIATLWADFVPSDFFIPVTGSRKVERTSKALVQNMSIF